ncbi:MAG: hypothetical protein BWY77_01323 [bacterium ADurb.Bin431]|nr:MAG: hypothetical protein BWY77_01323 [bacterium ADurb.Bin431]
MEAFLAQHALEVDGLAGAVEAPLREEQSGVLDRLGIPFIFNAETVGENAGSPVRGVVGKVLILVDEYPLPRFFPAIGRSNTQLAPARGFTQPLGPGDAAPEHLVAVITDLDPGAGHRRGILEVGHPDQIVEGREFGRNPKVGHLQEDAVVAHRDLRIGRKVIQLRKHHAGLASAEEPIHLEGLRRLDIARLLDLPDPVDHEKRVGQGFGAAVEVVSGEQQGNEPLRRDQAEAQLDFLLVDEKNRIAAVSVGLEHPRAGVHRDPGGIGRRAE